MNVTTTVETPDGSRFECAMSAAEADKCIAYLRKRLSHAERDEQLRLTEDIRKLTLVANPELAYEAHYRPEWYVPGWVANP